MRSISRVAGVSINTVTKLLVDAGEACLAMHDALVRNVSSASVQCDEIWSFCYAKQKNVAAADASPADAGDVWTWTGLDADTKLMVSYFVGDRSGEGALILADDLRARVASDCVQITTGDHNAHMRAIEEVFGADADYVAVENICTTDPKAMPGHYSRPICTGIKVKVAQSNADAARISTSYVERSRLSIRQFAHPTNAFSKKLDVHIHALALYFAFHNFVQIQKTLHKTPAMAAGITDRLWSLEDIAELIEDRRSQPGKRGTYTPRNPS